MKLWMKILVGVAGGLALLCLAGWLLLQRGEAMFQAGADAKRVNDVHKIAEMLEAYRKKTGHLPFSDELGPGKAQAITVLICAPTAEVKLRAQGNPLGREPPSRNASDLLVALRPALGDDLVAPIDPQRVANGAPPAYYVRLKPGDRYLVAAFLRSPRPHTTRVARTVYAYAIRSSDVAAPGWSIWANSRSVASVSLSERREIRTRGDAEDGKFGRYMNTATDGER